MALGHGITDSEDVHRINTCIRLPRTNFLQRWNGLNRSSTEVIRKSEGLCRIAVIFVFVPLVLYILACLQVSSLSIVSHAQFVIDALQHRLRGRNTLQQRNGVTVLPLLEKRASRGERVRLVLSQCDRNSWHNKATHHQ